MTAYAAAIPRPPRTLTYPVFKGQLFKVTDKEGYTRNGYDIRGHVLKTLRRVNQDSSNYVTTYTYDVVGRVKTLSFPKGSGTIQYTYDTGGNLQRIESLSGTITPEVFYEASQFNGLRQPGSIVYGNGVTNEYTYHTNSKQLQRIRAHVGGTDIQDLSYTYDLRANVTSITDNIPTHAGLASGTRSSMVYDRLNRLTSYTRPSGGTFTFGYDAIGNLTSNTEFGGTYTYPPSGTGSVRPHAVTSANGNSYSYDAAGNMIARGPAGNQQTLIYNARNLLEQIVLPGGGGSVTFGYDAAGKRLWKQNGSASTIWIGEHFEQRGNKELCHVMAEGRRICTFEKVPNPIPAGLDLIFRYYHPDHLHSANVVTNRSGAVVQEYQYRAFGDELYVLDSTQYPLLNRYTDQVLDADTGLYYYGCRYYDPQLGRFIQADTETANVYEPQELNRYTYVDNNPFKYIDPTGHAGFWSSIKNFVKGAILGDFAGEDAGIAGLAGQITVGFTPVGVFADVRDFAAASVKYIQGEGSLLQVGLAAAAVVPGVSEVRKARAALGATEEVAGKVLSHVDEAAEVAAPVVKNAERAGQEALAARRAQGVAGSRLGKEAAKSGPALARELGAAGEAAAGIVKNTKRIGSLTGTATYRIPDILNQEARVIGEVKNVSSLSYTNQLLDFSLYAQQKGYRFELWVRPTTQLSGPLQQAVGQGQILLRFLP